MNIDPPYNTGNDFIYKDNFKIEKNEYEEQIGLYDEEENLMFKNTETNGRFHSDWCSMMYPRLKLAHNLLSDDGVIFISIDDNEVENLKKICNEVFGDSNFVANCIWQSRTSISNDYEVSSNHNHTLIYSKQRDKLIFGGDQLDSSDYSNPDNDPRGPWKLVPIDANHPGGETYYPIVNPKTGNEYYPPNGRIWAYNKDTFQSLLNDGRIKFGLKDDSSPKKKLYLNERLEKGDKKTPSSLILDVGTTKNGTTEIMSLFNGKKVFDYPKPVQFIQKLIRYGATLEDGIILDFFSGSSTTAHAVMQLNAEDGGNRKFIMIQLPEVTDEKSEADKAGYKNICEIGRERIRRAGEKIKAEIEENNKQLIIGEEPKKVPDIGFRVLKVDSTNMKDVYYSANEYTQSMISDFESNIKEDRTDLDLLYGVMLDWGLKLSLSHKIEKVDGIKVHVVDEGSLVACFENKVTENAIREIAKRQPLRVVFRDSSFENSPDKINVTEIFKLLAPNTTIKVI